MHKAYDVIQNDHDLHTIQYTIEYRNMKRKNLHRYSQINIILKVYNIHMYTRTKVLTKSVIHNNMQYANTLSLSSLYD